jgi:outer membrane immunogenic protein
MQMCQPRYSPRASAHYNSAQIQAWGLPLKSLLLASAALVGTVIGAQAADMAAKAPYLKAPIATVYDWTGLYIGANAGVGLGRNKTNVVGFNADSLNTTHLGPQGAIGGAQIGYNWQTGSMFGPLVFGVEADIQGSGMRDDFTSLRIGETTAYDQRLDWFGTVRGRLGRADGPVMSYVTGGYAYGSVRTTLNQAAIGITDFGSRMQHGWTYGGGVEAALSGNWTAKIEALYVNLGNKTDVFDSGDQTLNTNIRERIYRVGLNYRIGGSGTYVPAPAANWAGLYLGGNIGGASARNRSSFVGSGANEFFNLSPDGVIGGAQAGYNWQTANWVYGLEADIQGSSQRDNDACITRCLVTQSTSFDAKLPWLGTVRGRLGYSIGSTLFYGTAGYAYGGVKTRITTIGNGPATDTTFSSTKSGWTVGGGIERSVNFFGMFGPNWTSKSEYLYVDLGSTADTLLLANRPVAVTTSIKEHIFRTGLNYHFNSPVAPKY